jgi:hypothetical protein
MTFNDLLKDDRCITEAGYLYVLICERDDHQ